jgi:hypothetical protein
VECIYRLVGFSLWSLSQSFSDVLAVLLQLLTSLMLLMLYSALRTCSFSLVTLVMNPSVWDVVRLGWENHCHLCWGSIHMQACKWRSSCSVMAITGGLWVTTTVVGLLMSEFLGTSVVLHQSRCLCCKDDNLLGTSFASAMDSQERILAEIF